MRIREIVAGPDSCRVTEYQNERGVDDWWRRRNSGLLNGEQVLISVDAGPWLLWPQGEEVYEYEPALHHDGGTVSLDWCWRRLTRVTMWRLAGAV